MKTLPATLALIALLPAAASAATNIGPTDKFAWSDTSGWVNFAPGNGGVSVHDDHLEGFAWAENLGWIKLGSYSGGGYHRYANSTATDWGVNLNGAALSGYGWSETAGWIRFDPTGGGVTLNPANGVFDGWAWAENLGWVHFKGATPAYNVLFTPSQQVTRVLMAASDPLQLRAAVAGSGVHLSADGGATWSAASTQPSDRRLKAAVAHPATPTTLYTASYGSGVFKSIDNGTHWAACANTGLHLNAYALVIDSGGTLYAATQGGVFASADCATWSAKTTGLPKHRRHLQPRPCWPWTRPPPGNLYAGVSGAGVYRSSNGRRQLERGHHPARQHRPACAASQARSQHHAVCRQLWRGCLQEQRRRHHLGQLRRPACQPEPAVAGHGCHRQALRRHRGGCVCEQQRLHQLDRPERQPAQLNRCVTP